MLQVTPEVRLQYRAGLVALVLLAGMAGCIVAAGLQVIEHSIVVTEYSADEAQSAAVVRGVARNTGAWPLIDCGVSVTFYDYDGKKLGEYSSSCKHLEPGENWNFNVELRGQAAWKVSRYSILTFTK